MKKILLISILLLLCNCSFSKFMLKQIDDNARHYGMVEKYVENEKFRMKYWIGGKGEEPLLLIHGFGYGSAFNWYPQIEDFSKKYKLIIPDLLCFGDSKLFVDDYSLDIQSEALHLILKNENIDTLNIVAHSYGGFVASNYLTSYPLNVNKFIVINSPLSGISEHYIDSIEQEFKVQSIADIVLPTSISELKRLHELSEGRKIHAPKSLLNNLYQNIIYHNGSNKRKIIQYLLSNNNYIDKTVIKGDFVVIWGKKDKIFTMRLVDTMKEKYNNKVELYIFDDEGHAPQIDNPLKFNKLVLSILGQNQTIFQNSTLCSRKRIFSRHF